MTMPFVALRLAALLLIAASAATAAPAQQTGPVSPPVPPKATTPLTIAVGTPVSLALRQRLRSGEAKKGDPVTFAVATDVRTPDGQHVLIPAGTPVQGVVEESRGGRSFGRPGTLKVRGESVLLPNGTRVPLQATWNDRGAGRRLASGLTIGAGTFVSVAAAGAMSLGDWGSGNDSGSGAVFVGGMAGTLLLGSLWRGGNVTWHEGRTFAAQVAQEVHLVGEVAAKDSDQAPGAAK